MYCKNCGKEIRDNDKFCRYCGAVVETAGKESAADGTAEKESAAGGAEEKAPATGKEAKEQSGQNNGNAGQNNGKTNDNRIVPVLVAAVIILACALLFVIVNQRSKGSGNTPAEAARESAAEPAQDNNGGAVPEEAATEEGADHIDQEAAEVNTITEDTSVGDLVYFGTYEQDNDPENGREPIEWVVLDEEDGQYLLITSEVIDEACYNNVWEPTTWESSSLRGWLNTSFLEEAFTGEQIDRIAFTEHTDEDGNSTDDQVFILNPEELEDYFETDNDRKAGATSYAEAQGVYEYSNGNCWWWVSEAGADPHYARYVNCEGAILEYGMLVFNNAFGVRPAIRVLK